MLGKCLDNVRKNVPLVHNIINYVTVNDVANILLACGGSPIMSDEPEDVEDITSICGGLNINIGTLNKSSIEGMYRAGKRAAELGHVILLDPVGAGASKLRTDTAVGLMDAIRFTVIRGNISEIKTLALGSGTTKGVAEKIASITSADIYEIKAAQEYTEADLDWNDSDSRTTHEQNDKSVRPEIGSDPVSLEGYSTIYIGFPIWWGEEPRIMDTFVESYDFDGKTMIPFCTSGGSGIGMSGKNLEANAGSGNWLDGERFGGGVSEEELQAWIDGLK